MAAAKQTSDLAKQPHSMPQVRDLGKWYTRLMINQRNKGFEAMPRPHNTIFCWAFDAGSFILKPSCLRCQRMFSKWIFSKNPHDINGRRIALKGLYARNALRYNKKNDTCSYCAETVAAAKIHLLRSGQLLHLGWKRQTRRHCGCHLWQERTSHRVGCWSDTHSSIVLFFSIITSIEPSILIEPIFIPHFLPVVSPHLVSRTLPSYRP